ncbi:MAG TPA: NAD-dependent epimerase/dehydratase family protein [Steroidobacteraceae bacterium]|nr:NAD-dependent epimerase/dehydratase family protein [Steroidobacteraceae bacterium]
MTTRRELLRLAAGVTASASLPLAAAAPAPKPRAKTPAPTKTLLILGGTGFIGPHLTEEALRHGWKVTHFNRGKKSAGTPAGVETLIGNRGEQHADPQLDALRNRHWDAVVDDTGFIPKFVKMSAQLLAPNVGYCLYISSISVYASFAKPNDERSPVGKLEDVNIQEVTDTSYGPMKALCEQYSMEAFKGRGSVVRPGYIVGPLDGSDRFTYWPVRASRGGDMLAPGTPGDPIQIIDVRDLAVWMMKLVETRTRGTYNAVSPPRDFKMGDLIQASREASPDAGTQVTWVSEDFLAAHWKAEELDLPPWAPMKGESAGAALTAMTAAAKTGLHSRPLPDTVRDTLAWFRTLPPERQAKLRAGLDTQKEADTLRSFHAGEKGEKKDEKKG